MQDFYAKKCPESKLKIPQEVERRMLSKAFQQSSWCHQTAREILAARSLPLYCCVHLLPVDAVSILDAPDLDSNIFKSILMIPLKILGLQKQIYKYILPVCQTSGCHHEAASKMFFIQFLYSEFSLSFRFLFC